MKKFRVVILLITVLMLTSCGSKSSKDMTASDNNIVPEISSQQKVSEEPSDFGSVGKKSGESTEANSKSTIENAELKNHESKMIIDRGNLTIETVEFDNSIESLYKSISDFKGYLESSNINQPSVSNGNYKTYRSGDFVVRIPKDNFQNFIKSAENLGLITNEGTSTEDITKEFYDIDTRLKVYQAKETRYLELLDEAKTIEDILSIENHLTEVRYNIEYLTGYRNQMKDLVDYGTVQISINEVDKVTELTQEPKTLGQKIVNMFKQSLKSLTYLGTTIVIVIVAVIPYAIIVGGIGWVVVYFYKLLKIRKVKNNKVKNNKEIKK